jgi:hypothetical protein
MSADGPSMPCAEQHQLTEDKSKQRCDWCSAPFTRRHGSGGSRQRFCTADCRLTFHKERLRSQRSVPYAGPTTQLATAQPTPTETLTREPAIAELPPWETGVLDIAKCDGTEFAVALNECETAGTRIETWPSEVRALIDHHVSRWIEENKETRTIRTMTVAAPKHQGVQSCVLILHHSQKKQHGHIADIPGCPS